jgi:EipB-like
MMQMSPCLVSSAVGAALLTAAICGPAAAEPQAGGIALASHLAIYDLKLANSRGKRSLESVQGRIVYDFSTACEGYGLQFRQVTSLDSGEGKRALSDLRATSWEDAEAKSFRFTSQNYLDDRLVENVDGNAERQSEGVAVKLTKPERKQFNAGGAVFPTEHMRDILAAAHEGKSLLQVNVYDGSDNGQKVYQSLTVIGRKIAANERKPADAAATNPALAALDRWPVTISYFDKGNEQGEQTPVYSISFELYENGISRALVLDYGDFAVSGDMTSLELRNTKPCR